MTFIDTSRLDVKEPREGWPPHSIQALAYPRASVVDYPRREMIGGNAL